MPLDILIFAGIAAFFVWKLRQVLGQKHGDERERPNRFTLQAEIEKQRAEQARAAASESANNETIDGEAREVGASAGALPAPPPAPQGSLAGALAALRAADKNFDEKAFVQGARTAFSMIVEAFARGDLETLRGLLKPHVFVGFEAEIARRQAAGETMHATIQRILAADLAQVRLDGEVALVTVDFTSEQVTATTNTTGEVLDGDLKKPQVVAESWTFERNTSSADPTWFLLATRSR